MLYLWCSSPRVNMFVKRLLCFLFLVTSVCKQQCYELSLRGLMTQGGSACLPRYSQHPHPNLWHDEIERTLKKMLHNSLKAKNKIWRTVTCIFFNIQNKYFSNQKVCMIEQMKERWCKHLLYKKKGNILKPHTIIFIYNVFLQTFTGKHKCVANLLHIASGYDNSPAGTGDSIPSRCLNPTPCKSVHKWRRGEPSRLKHFSV